MEVATAYGWMADAGVIAFHACIFFGFQLWCRWADISVHAELQSKREAKLLDRTRVEIEA